MSTSTRTRTSGSESAPLNVGTHSGYDATVTPVNERGGMGHEGSNTGEMFDNVPRAKRRLGLFSAASLIFNRVIGTGYVQRLLFSLQTSE